MKKFKAIAGYIVLLATLAFFVYYVIKHPQFWHELNNLNLFIIILLLFLYLLFLGTSILILKYTVEYCSKVINFKNNLQLSSYSAIINFFGPLQSGPGFRAVYLKTNFKITIKQFFEASIIYYLFFAAISAICIVVGSSYWRWTIVLAPVILAGAYIVFLWEKNHRNKNQDNELVNKKRNRSVALKIGLATLLQILLVSIIYFTELRTVNHLITFRQAIAYTGIANFALFVSITPGAIGIREAFLLFSQRLLHMPSKTIIAASVIDRAVYVVFLGILFIFVATLHVNNKLTAKKTLKTT
jgi:uncharacterized membrane protein YbhN (UPF0104 family)